MRNVCVVNRTLVDRSGRGVQVPFAVRNPAYSHQLVTRMYANATIPTDVEDEPTHPVLWSPVWLHNFAESFLHNAVPLFWWLQGRRTDQPLIVDTHDRRAPPYLIDLIAPFSSHPVRVLSTMAPRCFAELTIVRWLSPAFDRGARPAPVFETGRFVGDFYDAGSKEPPRDTLVVADHRSGRRALRTSIDALCAHVGRCAIHDFANASFADSVRLMRQARIFVGVHGAGLANAFFMSRPSVLVEIRPYAFEGGWPDLYYRDHLQRESMHMTIGMADPRLCHPRVRINASAYEGWNGRCTVSNTTFAQAISTARQFVADPSSYRTAPPPSKYLTQIYRQHKRARGTYAAEDTTTFSEVA